MADAVGESVLPRQTSMFVTECEKAERREEGASAGY